MHLIYKHAVRTVVFLGSGEAYKHAGVSLSALKLFFQLRRAHKQGEGEVLREFQELFTHPWFQRVWILQEIGMSDVLKVKVYYKGTTVQWDILSLAATLLGAHSLGHKYNLVQLPPSVRRHAMITTKWTALGGSGYSYLSSLDRYGKMSNGFNQWLYTRFFLWAEPRLTEVLQDSRFCLATDPRDKIYSLLNMLNFSTGQRKFAWLLDVDYSLPLAEVYSRAARYSIETECSLEILCYKEGSATISDLPTWVPDWTAQRLFPMHRIAVPNNYRSQFHDTIWPEKSWMPPLRKTSNQTPVASFSADSSLVTLHGYKLDTIDTTSSIWQAALDSSDDVLFEEWAAIYTGDSTTEITSVAFKPERWPLGIQTTSHSICDFWLRVGRHPRLKTSDTLTSFSSNHIAQERWRRGSYRRHRFGRVLLFIGREIWRFSSSRTG